jgi:hypothetical protein
MRKFIKAAALILAGLLLFSGCHAPVSEEEPVQQVSQEAGEKQKAEADQPSNGGKEEPEVTNGSDESASETDSQKEIADDGIWEVGTTADIFHRYYEIATEEQKKKLDEFDKAEKAKSTARYQRQILMIMGVIPEDMPRITVEQAREICDEVAEMRFQSENDYRLEIMRRFNAVCGAPDMAHAAGPVYTYFLDNDGEQKILVALNGVGVVKGEMLGRCPYAD